MPALFQEMQNGVKTTSFVLKNVALFVSSKNPTLEKPFRLRQPILKRVFSLAC